MQWSLSSLSVTKINPITFTPAARARSSGNRPDAVISIAHVFTITIITTTTTTYHCQEKHWTMGKTRWTTLPPLAPATK
jgi:hypothetical protein